MKWRDFSGAIDQEKCSCVHSEKGCLSKILGNKADIRHISKEPHPWYPKGLANGDFLAGYNYVDINNSCLSREPLLVAEASCCILIFLIDNESETRFVAHVSASSDSYSRLWLAMELDLVRYFKQIGHDMTRPELFLFSEYLALNAEGSFEHKNVMKLFSSVLNRNQLLELSRSTYLIEGEDGYAWNPYCTVKSGINSSGKSPPIEISFAVHT